MHKPEPRTSAGSGAAYCRQCYRPIQPDGTCKCMPRGVDTSTPEERAALNRLAQQITRTLSGAR